MQAEELLRQRRLTEALEKLQEDVRSDPSNPKLRVFLFQLLSVLGQWERAMTQLNVAADLDAQNLLMANVCRPALNSEALRAEIWAGRRSPLILGEPKEWVGWILQANQMAVEGHYKQSQELRERAFERAPAIPGTINEEQFEWIADADPRLGPILEAIVNGAYYWVPFTNVREVRIEPPSDLRDMVWTPAVFTWANGGTSAGLIPTRYPGSEDSEQSAILMSHKTEWIERKGGLHEGLGQRLLITDESEYALLDVRQITLENADVEKPSQEAKDG
jgi:type VI secretion system protein ImpE